jgi:putative NADPH-quinone reductase
VIAEHAEVVKQAQILVFVYASSMYTLPARLKGWLERVMVPGVAFRFNSDGKVRPALGSVRKIVGIATYDQSWWKVKLVNDNGRRILCRALRLNTGFRTRTRWVGVYGGGDPIEATGKIARALSS